MGDFRIDDGTLDAWEGHDNQARRAYLRDDPEPYWVWAEIDNARARDQASRDREAA